ncbi:hypothetical protein [Chitinasiproducens palmae]|uniref:hypothetical protein n=1 Tax=Chitinasiproducens palmae TaxID=1770053 RepID=UPI00147EA8D6|nr:hypothetical protein [Chitinasiproducens palmae]
MDVVTAEQVIPRATLDKVNALIDANRAHSPVGLPTGLVVAAAVADASAACLREVEAFRQLEAQLRRKARLFVARYAGKRLDERPLHIVRCVDRTTGRESHCRHFDSHALTVLIPLQIAEDGSRNGDLLIYRRRRTPPSTLVNLLDKARHGAQRNLPLRLRRTLTDFDLRHGRCDRVRCVPGNVYAFNGFVTQHANLDILGGERRSLLIHWYDPGASAGVSTALRRIRRICDRLRGA